MCFNPVKTNTSTVDPDGWEWFGARRRGAFFSLVLSLAMSIGVVFNREVRISHLTEMGVPVLPLFWAGDPNYIERHVE